MGAPLEGVADPAAPASALASCTTKVCLAGSLLEASDSETDADDANATADGRVAALSGEAATAGISASDELTRDTRRRARRRDLRLDRVCRVSGSADAGMGEEVDELTSRFEFFGRDTSAGAALLFGPNSGINGEPPLFVFPAKSSAGGERLFRDNFHSCHAFSSELDVLTEGSGMICLSLRGTVRERAFFLRRDRITAVAAMAAAARDPTTAPIIMPMLLLALTLSSLV